MGRGLEKSFFARHPKKIHELNCGNGTLGRSLGFLNFLVENQHRLLFNAYGIPEGVENRCGRLESSCFGKSTILRSVAAWGHLLEKIWRIGLMGERSKCPNM